MLPRVPPRGQSWHHNANDRLTRKLMMLRLRHLHPVLAGTKCSGRPSVVGPSLVQRLEWMLYNAAHSMHEYTHEQSLERRVQALVTQLEPQAVAQERRGTKRRMEPQVDELPCKKRQCVDEDPSGNRERSVFLLDNDVNLVGLVASFLSGRTVLRLRAVNRFMQAHAPSMVSTLHLETHAPALRHFSSGALTSLLLSCSRLSSLVVTSSLHKLVPGRTTARTQGHPHRPSFSRRDGALAGELVLRDIARAFAQGACPQLQALDLGSPLDYFAESDDVLTCLEAFVAGGRQRGAAFKRLRLDSTYLGDARLARLAAVFELSSCLHSLDTLVLRSNFIGEAGCHALLRMLRCLPSLRVLDVSGNILTDIDALALAEWISPSVSRNAMSPPLLAASQQHSDAQIDRRRSGVKRTVRLRSLLVQDNFLSREGVNALTSALCAQEAIS